MTGVTFDIVDVGVRPSPEDTGRTLGIWIKDYPDERDLENYPNDRKRDLANFFDWMLGTYREQRAGLAFWSVSRRRALAALTRLTTSLRLSGETRGWDEWMDELEPILRAFVAEDELLGRED